ncbi:DUF6498-containing protein [Hyphomonas oceanitis]|uniref:Uncharacterized protein n=1 Tax=Hyphomonas oceanitis SCH89 TaxID=1280953 RepID=A0A059GC66_9PROT|nr:DUF6498-containing protein [Hyphomonas oceanitis]KDA04371.1 hypothetical protein HOC_00760 [Hyphomonas oceanitis SCH89]
MSETGSARFAGRFLDPSLIARTYRDPLAWMSLATDLVPIAAILVFGWGATPLVALYWLENLIIGAYTILRLGGAAVVSFINLATALFMIPFFTFHYGMFCYGHGLFIRSFAGGEGNGGGAAPMDLVTWALGSGDGMLWFVGLIIVTNAVFFLVDYIGRGEFRRTDPPAEMFAPYGRIVTLHVAIILGAFIAIATDERLLGVLILIAIRVLFGIVLSLLRRMKLDGGLGKLAGKFAQPV